MTKFKYTHDYTKTMMMKMPISMPDRKGGTIVKINCQQALDTIIAVDSMTLGVPKIVYLVGWQYLGHDDKYPDFFDANTAIKRAEDATAEDSIRWLMSEAKRYNTIVSFHINFNDVYDDAPSFNDYIINNAVIRTKRGNPHAIENYNGKKCYKTCFKNAWESGLFARQIDRLLSIYPLEEAGTLHVDNFQCYTNYCPSVSIYEMSEYREKMIDYLRARNIDITSEFTYREDSRLPNKKFWGTPRDHRKTSPLLTLGKIPAAWWVTYLSNQEIVDISPQQFAGGILRNGTHNDPRKDFIYGNMHGEDHFDRMIAGDKNWMAGFLKEFATVQIPYYYLCEHKRLSISGRKGSFICHYQDNIESQQHGEKIVASGNIIKDGDNLCMPLVLNANYYIAYSQLGDKRKWTLLGNQCSRATLYNITSTGNQLIGTAILTNGRIELDILPKQALLIITE